ncbi:hypothetical protein M885DRAFT_511429 [Pelagophyceae sp. CCMP2097]|nr:hypothetical protein M885DRAFT_511429 [Pelagophyceae sp. CCMP2097]
MMLRWRALVSIAIAADALAPGAAWQALQKGRVLDGRGAPASPVDGLTGTSLVIVLPQLGEFDSSEFVEQLVAVELELRLSSVELRVVGLGSVAAAKKFSEFSGLPLSKLRVTQDAQLHDALGLHAGPNWDIPSFASDGFLKWVLAQLPGGVPKDRLRPVARAWLNYLAMCAGIAAPGTLPEILRGYFGDFSAPERLAPETVVSAGFVTIGPGVGPVKLGPFKYDNAWASEKGYQRPVELASVRLRNMVEVLSNWEDYVSDASTIDRRGATFIFDGNGQTLYEYKHPGVLTYSQTMSRPLTFLAPFIGVKALNPLGLGDQSLSKTVVA